MRSDRANDLLQAQIGLKNSVAAGLFENVELQLGLRVHQRRRRTGYVLPISDLRPPSRTELELATPEVRNETSPSAIHIRKSFAERDALHLRCHCFHRNCRNRLRVPRRPTEGMGVND
jgi:hypothetical protein